jgi:hypothetical protein
VLLHESESKSPAATFTPSLRFKASQGVAIMKNLSRRWRWSSPAGTRTFIWRGRPRLVELRLVGRTLDDAAGEAYDKVAKLLGFGYPGRSLDRRAGALRQPEGRAVCLLADQTKKLHLAGKVPRTKGAAPRPSPTSTRAFSVFVFGNQDGRAALRGAARSCAPRSPGARGTAFCLLGQGASPPQTKEEALWPSVRSRRST